MEHTFGGLLKGISRVVIKPDQDLVVHLVCNNSIYEFLEQKLSILESKSPYHLYVPAGSDNPLVEVEYKGKQSNVILVTQGESTLKIFG